MWTVEGTFKGKPIPKARLLTLEKVTGTSDYKLSSLKQGSIELKDNIISVDVISQETATGGGVQGAASGAVLGFLVLGPIGTVMGAGLGSQKKGKDNTTLLIMFANGDRLVVDRVETEELAILKRLMVSTKLHQPQNISNSSAKSSSAEQLPNLAVDLKIVEGRKPTDKTELPKLPFLSKWKAIEGCNKKAVKLFNIKINEELQKYNHFKWLYFDKKLESENELDLIAKKVLENLIVQSNQSKKSKGNEGELEKELKNLGNSLNVSATSLKETKKELSEASFLSKSGINKKIKTIEGDIQSTISLMTEKKKQIASHAKKFGSSKDLKGIKNTSNEFVSIFSKALPDFQKPKNNLKTKKNIDDQFFLDVYQEVSEKIQDQKTKAEKEKVKKAKKKETKKKPESSTKEKLLELKELLDEELITEDEYQESRKKLLDKY